MIRSRTLLFSFLFCGTVLFCCKSDKHAEDKPIEGSGNVQAVSLLGKPLHTVKLSDERLVELERKLAQAEETLERTPDDEDAIIWVGRRTAYLGRYLEAIEIYTQGIELHPESAKLMRHRGHRYITVRKLSEAIHDLEQAQEKIAGTGDEIEPDGMPNARNIPTSTLHSNIWYHLGLAYYLTGDFEHALSAYRECMKVSNNPDMQVATAHWLYMTLRRLGRNDEAARVLEPIHADMDIIENGGYHHLLLLYKGELEPASLLGAQSSAINDASIGYGIGNWHLYNGRKAEARLIFRQMMDSEQWAAFGYIAAEAELSRM